MPFPDDKSDADLARAAQAGSREAFGELTLRHYPAVHAFLLSLLANRTDAEDLTQDTFLRALTKLHHFDPGQPFRPWVFTLARRLAITRWRRHKPTSTLDDSIPHPHAPTPQSAHDAAALWSLAREHLKPNEFAALWLFYREDLPVKDIARVLKKSEANAKVILHRARTTLREHLSPESWLPSHRNATAIQPTS